VLTVIMFFECEQPLRLDVQ